jgi:hypothetical protein
MLINLRCSKKPISKGAKLRQADLRMLKFISAQSNQYLIQSGGVSASMPAYFIKLQARHIIRGPLG